MLKSGNHASHRADFDSDSLCVSWVSPNRFSAEKLHRHSALYIEKGHMQVIATGRRKHFYAIDLASAKVERVSHLTNREEKSLENFVVSPLPGHPLIAFLGARGHLPLVSLHSRQVVAQLKMSGTVRSATFTDDGTYLLASGGSCFPSKYFLFLPNMYPSSCSPPILSAKRPENTFFLKCEEEMSQEEHLTQSASSLC